MIISITPPKVKRYKKIISDSQLFFNNEYESSIFVGKDQSFYVFISKRNIMVNIINDSKDNVKLIEDYLEKIFCGYYIGISKNAKDTIKLQNVEVFYL